MVPEFAVVGHPNEGKSSVVSTLTEDDRIRVSRIPGETIKSTSYTVRIDGRDIIRFVDTPGFQVPRQTLAWFRKYEGLPGEILDTFLDTFQNDSYFADECELLRPVANGAGIIYVVDGSRPVRDDDLAEMEILRLTGRPRMAIINSKTDRKDYTSEWRHEFRKHFNAVRIFNSNTADFSERIKMLESLKGIDQEWEPALSDVIAAFKQDWRKRNRLACAAILQGFEQILGFTLSEPVGPETDQQALYSRYQENIRALEARMFRKIRALFKHHVFEYHLPDWSILQHDLFSKQTWALLGLTREQLMAVGAVLGGTVGIMIDTAAHGTTFGLFTALGGILGAGSALIGGRKITGRPRRGLRLGGDRIQLGPARDPQFIFILLDRVLLYYSHIINRPHGRRDPAAPVETGKAAKEGFTARLSADRRHVCARYFKAVTGRAVLRETKAAARFEKLVETLLEELSDSVESGTP